MKYKIKTIFFCTLLIISMLATGTTFAYRYPYDTLQSPTADYGDAPDPMFPSLISSSGPYHKNLNDCYVGSSSTSELDALVPDLDSDDGAPIIYAAQTPNIWTGWAAVPITIDTSAPNINRYLNVLLDVDSSGTWCNIPGEWIARNYKVYHWPPWLGLRIWYCIGGFTWIKDFSGFHWMRITVSDTPITANTANGWDGRDPNGGAGFERGETEDWLVQWHYDPYGPIPPHDPNNPPGPIPIPECNKIVAGPYQIPSNRHVGHSGPFKIGVKNTGSHPVHITDFVITGPWGDDITIKVKPGESLVCNTIQPGETISVNASWEFAKVGTNKAWCDFDIGYDPDNQYGVAANVGDYISPTSDQSTGGVFEERIDNNPPDLPDITGDISGEAGSEYEYTFVTTDPEGDNLYYDIEWGDDSGETDLGPYASGEEFTAKHYWNEEGTYIIRAKAKDDWDGAESDWGTLEVSMPKNKIMEFPFLRFIKEHIHIFPLLQILQCL